MLVLSRKRGETLYVGDDVKITILDVQGKRVRIGIDAPGHCRVMRGELCDGPAPAEVAATRAVGAPSTSEDPVLPFLTAETVAAECVARPLGVVRDAIYSFSLEDVVGRSAADRRRPLKSK